MSDFKVTRYKLRASGMSVRGPEEPFSIVFLSDLHNKSYGKGNERLLQEIRNQDPEAVLIGGDLLTSAGPPQMEAASGADEGAYQMSTLIDAVNGNHEQRLKEQTEKYGDAYDYYSQAVRSFGVHLLENTSEYAELCRMPFRIWGYEASSGLLSQRAELHTDDGAGDRGARCSEGRLLQCFAGT